MINSPGRAPRAIDHGLWSLISNRWSLAALSKHALATDHRPLITELDEGDGQDGNDQ